MSDVDEFLAHYGVKGMRWGHRKTQTSAQQIQKLEKKLDRLDGHKILRGAELSGWAVGKGKKNPGAYAKRNVAARGAIEVAALLGGGYGLMKVMGLRNTTETMASVALLSAGAGAMRMNEIRSVSQYEKSVKIHEELGALRKAGR